jgi:hypothetical protein
MIGKAVARWPHRLRLSKLYHTILVNNLITYETLFQNVEQNILETLFPVLCFKATKGNNKCHAVLN